MKLLHRRGVLAQDGLDERDQTVYGFDTTQHGFKPLTGSFSKISGDLKTDMDGFFNVVPFDFYIALEIEKGGMATNSNGRYNNQNYLDRNDNSTGSEWYGKMKETVEDFNNSTTGTQFGPAWTSWDTRFKGIRWNHEYRLSAWDRGTTWWNWAISETGGPSGLAADVKTNYLTEWDNALGSMSATTSEYLPSYDFANNSGKAASPPWNASAYNKPKDLFGSYFVDYMCRREATIIGHIADVLSEVHSSLKLIIYPPNTVTGESPSGRPNYEYSLDLNLVDKSNIVWELGGWGRSDFDQAWIAEAASSAGTHDFFVTMQQTDDTTLPSPLADVGSWVDWRLNATNADEASPWDSSFGFWTDWASPLKPLSAADQGSYMDEIKDELV